MSLIQRIDALLPQTQCGKCGHAGCKPYAQGIALGEAINKCPPGGTETIIALANLLNTPALALDRTRGEAPAQVAFIREAECIGCTKCIQACPVDAIMGAAKLMHSVIVDECTGCDLCVAPCPVDCIEMHPLPAHITSLVGELAIDTPQYSDRQQKREQARRRFEQRNTRLQREAERKRLEQTQNPAPQAPLMQLVAKQSNEQAITGNTALKKAKVNLAMSRAQLHKSLKAFGHPPTRPQQEQLVVLQRQLEIAEFDLAALEAKPVVMQAATPENSTALKRAKIQLALRRAELKKAIAENTSAEHLKLLNKAATLAEQNLLTAQHLCDEPADSKH